MVKFLVKVKVKARHCCVMVLFGAGGQVIPKFRIAAMGVDHP